MPKYKRTPEAMAKELRRDWDDNEARYEHAQKVIIERARRYLYSLSKRQNWILIADSGRSVRIQATLSNRAEYENFLEITLLAQGAEEKHPWDMKILNPNVLHSKNFRGWDYTAELSFSRNLEKATCRYYVLLTETKEKIKEFLGYIPEETPCPAKKNG